MLKFNMRSQLREQAIKLRLEKEFSYTKIRQELGVPKSTLSYWLRELPLSKKRVLELRRVAWSKSEAKIERFRETMREKRNAEDKNIYEKYKRKFFNFSEDIFFASGLMLYLAEGTKNDYYRIALTNTDYRIIKFFIKWLNEFLNIPKDKMRVGLHLYEDMNIKNEKEFWGNKLEIKESQFYRPWIRKIKKNSFSYKGSFRHGTCVVYVLGGKKKRELAMAMQAFIDKYLLKMGA